MGLGSTSHRCALDCVSARAVESTAWLESTALRREAHTPLQLITDDEYAAGVARLHKAARTETGPVVDALDLLVLTC